MDPRLVGQTRNPSDAHDHLPHEDSAGSNGGAGTKRRAQISVACDSCRSKKIKCSGDRPTCAFCEDRKLECTYDRDPDVTRLASLRHRHLALEHEADQMRRLIDALHGASHQDSQDLLRRLRSHASLDDVLRSLLDGRLLSAPAAHDIADISPAILAEASSAIQMSSQFAARQARNGTSPASSSSSQRSPAIAPSNPMRIENLLLGRATNGFTSRPTTSQSATSQMTDQRTAMDSDMRPRQVR